MIAKHAKSKLLISIVSESLPHLKRGCIRDFKNILGEEFDDRVYNKTEQTYHFKNADIEFFGADETAKVHGPRRHILYINEANNIPWETARGLDIRTSKFTFLDWNPVSEFWAHEQWIGKPENAYIHSTYQDAVHVLPAEVIANIESNKNDPNWWNIYGLGRIGKIEGLVYPFFDQVDSLPDGGTKVYGLDFGFSNDFTALTKNALFPGKVYSQEFIYEVGMTNRDIAYKMEELGLKKHFDEIIADSAEPKSIEEIAQYGWNIKGCVKGADSVEFGHQRLRQLKQYWTKDSLNAIKEQRNFRYIQDKNGKFTDKTTHRWSHTMDSRRYAVTGAIPEDTENVQIYDSIQEEHVNLDI